MTPKVDLSSSVIIFIDIGKCSGLQDGQACKGSPSIGARHDSPVVVQAAHWNQVSMLEGMDTYHI